MDRLQELHIREHHISSDIKETYRMNDEYGEPLRRQLEQLLKETEAEIELILSRHFSD